MRFLSTPSARRATGRAERTHHARAISIHALREEGDVPCDSVCQTIEDFYPRPPRGGRRCQPRPGSRPDQFLSTPSARRATATPGGDYSGVHISIHALREEGDLAYSAAWSALQISIHALREEGDLTAMMSESIQHISIHALREEGDTQAAIIPTAPRYFYPRPPRGGRLGDVRRYFNSTLFLSTPSARRATHKRL